MMSTNISYETHDVFLCLIPAFNNPTYVKQTLRQLSKFRRIRPVILDNASSYKPILDLYSEIEAGYYGDVRIMRLGCNPGPRAIWYSGFQSLPNYFCITDPDLEFNINLPDDFMDNLVGITETYMIGKAGFALSLDDRDLMQQAKFRHCEGWLTIWEAEAKNWKFPLPDFPSGDPMYLAHIDTTFAVYNKRYFDPIRPFNAIRVAGRYTCRHLPWYVNNGLPAEEEAFYREAAEFSYYMGNRPAFQVRELFKQQDIAALTQRPS